MFQFLTLRMTCFDSLEYTNRVIDPEYFWWLYIFHQTLTFNLSLILFIIYIIVLNKEFCLLFLLSGDFNKQDDKQLATFTSQFFFLFKLKFGRN